MNNIESRTHASFATGTRLFVRMLAVAHLFAFGSFWYQSAGLVGPHGVLPAKEFFSMAHEQLGLRAYLEAPSLCWVFGAGHFIDILCAVGIGTSILLLAGLSQALCLATLWVCYLSLCSAGQIFMDFQWDSLLLEATLVAGFLVPWQLGRSGRGFDPPKLARYLLWWLLFRLMFLSGITKLSSGDPTWRDLSALVFHYQTQPLPTVLAWYLNAFPLWFHKISCAFVFAVELGAPFCLLAPRRVRNLGAVSLIGLQLLIAITGNYAFFNLLTIGLCLTCLDDAWWSSLHLSAAPSDVDEAAKCPAGARMTLLRWFAAFSVGITFFESTAAVSRVAARSPLVRAVAEAVGPFRSFNDYGLFAVMTVERPELVIEGSNDAKDWKPYTLPFKPGDLARRPAWVAPYQPRLDWQLWFAALAPPESSPWVGTVCEKLLRGEPAVESLFAQIPFPGSPPLFLRVVRYRYEFTSPAERASTGNWWRRTPIDFYIPAVTLPKDK